MNEQIMSVKDVAKELQCTEETIRRMCRGRKLPHFKIGSSYRFNRVQLNNYYLSKEVDVINEEEKWDSTNAKDPTIGILESVTTDEKYEKLLEQ